MGDVTHFDWHPVWLSLKVGAAALLLTFAGGTLAARLLAERRFPGKNLLEAVFMLPLVLPPVVTGYVLLVLVGRHGPIGSWLELHFDIRIIFTPFAAVLAAATVAFPLMYQTAKAAFLGIEPHLQEAAQALGAGSRRVFFTITMPLAWHGLAAGAALAFARALGEFGATLMVAGNIPGRTTTVPVAIYMAAEDGDMRVAGIYSLLIAVFNLVFLAVLSNAMRQRR